MAKMSVLLVGDAASAKRAFHESGDAAEGFAAKSQEAAVKVKEAALETVKAFAPMVAGFAAAEFAKGAVENAEQLRKAQDGLNIALEKTGGNVRELAPRFQEVAKGAAEFGVNQVTATQSLQRATLLTGNAQAAMRAYNEALVISKATGKDFNAVLVATSKAQDGQTGALGRYGVQLQKGADGQKQLNQVMERFGGQADANTSASDKLRANFDNLQTSIGTVLLPAFDAIVEAINKVVTWFESSEVRDAVSGFTSDIRNLMQPIVDWVETNWPQIKTDITTAVQDAWTVVKGVIGLFEAGWREFGGTIKTIIRNDLGAVKQVFEGVVETIRGIIDIIRGIAHGNWAEVWDGIKEVALGPLKALLAWPEAQAKNFAAVFTKLGGIILGAFRDGIAAAAAALRAAINIALINPINAAIEAIDSFKIHFGGISIFGHKIAAFDWGGLGIPKIPTLDTGGIVTKTGLAVVDRGETFSGVGPGAHGLGGLTVNVNIGPIHGTADAGFAQIVGDQIATQLRGNHIPALASAIRNL